MTRRSWPRSAARVSRRRRSGPQVFVDRFCDTGFERRSAAAAHFAGDIVRFTSGTGLVLLAFSETVRHGCDLRAELDEVI